MSKCYVKLHIKASYKEKPSVLLLLYKGSTNLYMWTLPSEETVHAVNLSISLHYLAVIQQQGLSLDETFTQASLISITVYSLIRVLFDLTFDINHPWMKIIQASPVSSRTANCTTHAEDVKFTFYKGHIRDELQVTGPDLTGAHICKCKFKRNSFDILVNTPCMGFLLFSSSWR